MHFSEYIYNIKPLKTLLDSGRDVNVTNYRGESILIETVKYNRVEHVKLLMENKADTNVIDDKRDTPLLAACRTGHTECLALLFTNSENKPDVNSKDNSEETGAMLAAKNGHVDCLEFLLRNDGVDLSLTNEKGENALMLAAEWNQLDCARILLENGIDKNAYNLSMDRKSALHIACLLGHDDIAKVLIDFKADVNILQHAWVTPLMCAALKNRAKCAQHLLEADADVNICDVEGVTAAMMACCKGSSEVLEILLNAGVNINVTDIYGGHCLKHAVRNRSWKCVDLLLAHGAFVKDVYNVHVLCGDDPEACDKLTKLFYIAGGHNYVGDENSVAEEKRKADRERREASKEIAPLLELSRNVVYEIFTSKYPGTNRFPLVQALPGPIGQKRLLLNGMSLDVDVPLDRALKCTSYEPRYIVCSMCLRSEAELRIVDCVLTPCSQCRLLAYCSERCDQNHWVMAHMPSCAKDLRSKTYGPVCAWCLRPCTRDQDYEFVPCETCERTVYCSTICRHADWISVHKNFCFKRRLTAQYVNLR